MSGVRIAVAQVAVINPVLAQEVEKSEILELNKVEIILLSLAYYTHARVLGLCDIFIMYLGGKFFHNQSNY